MASGLLPTRGYQIRHDTEELKNLISASWGRRSYSAIGGMFFMVKNSPFEQATGASRDGLWLHLGNRLRFRREQLGIGSPTAAAHVGVALKTYEEYETGERLIPANQLANLAELLAVPVFYFFEDLPIGEETSDAQQLTPDVVYSVATETDRIAALIDDFLKLDFDRQQHLLVVARALANDTPSSGTSA